MAQTPEATKLTASPALPETDSDSSKLELILTKLEDILTRLDEIEYMVQNPDELPGIGFDLDDD